MLELESKLVLKRKYKNEQVFVVPYNLLNHIQNKFTRINDNNKKIWTEFDNIGKYIYRHDAEGLPEIQQIISYIIIKNPRTNKFFITERLKGESRIKSALSLGVGGHINLEDGYIKPLLKATFRELHEEMYIKPISDPKFIGYVRDMTSATNDHTGCVFTIDSTNNCRVKETKNLKGQWMTYDELEENYHKFESWAKYIIDYMCANKGVL